MSQIVITIKTGRDALTDRVDSEAVRILRDITKRISREGILDTWLYDSELYDINGKKCGQLTVQS